MSIELLAIEEEVFKVIANQKRLEIILLLEHQEMNVGQMALMLGLRQANVSQHLSLLRQQRLVAVRKKGRESFYHLADQSIAQSIRIIRDFLRTVHRVDLPDDGKGMFPIVTDPVCGMRFSAARAFGHKTSPDGVTHYFCASGCMQTFDAMK